MVTYFNGYKRVEVTDTKHIEIFHKTQEILFSLSEEEYEKAIEFINNYIYDGGVANANKLRGLAKKLNLTMWDLALWGCLEE